MKRSKRPMQDVRLEIGITAEGIRAAMTRNPRLVRDQPEQRLLDLIQMELDGLRKDLFHSCLAEWLLEEAQK